MRSTLDPYSDVKSGYITKSKVYHHINYKDLVAIFPEIQSYKKFIVIRDPLDRFFSLYRHHLQHIDGLLRRIDSFSPTLGMYLYVMRHCIFKSQLTQAARFYVGGSEFRVFRLEDPELVNRVSAYLDIPVNEMEHLNSSTRHSVQASNTLLTYFVSICYRRDFKLYRRVVAEGSALIDE